ncbi:MAG: glycoside hydrolase family 43 protein [Planctomycetia bacterium]|nr:glycoside hydrolase family 43 protein [Planctomycetia bacterium]
MRLFTTVLLAATFALAMAFASTNYAEETSTAPKDAPAFKSGPGIESGYYVFCYFRDNGQDGLHYAVSRDGYKWTPLNNDESVLMPPVDKNTKLIRDPSITRGSDGIFRMVWTVAWDGRHFGYACSDDLIEWRDAIAVPAMDFEPTTRNTWAPEIFYDEPSEQFYIFWSSTIPGRFSPADQGTSETKYDHRAYYTTTKDFKTFTPTKIFFNPDHNVIDGFLFKKNDSYYLFYKDETLFPEAKKIILYAKSDSPEGPWTKGVRVSPQNWVEGPSVLDVNGDWLLYYDCYTANKYAGMRSLDGENWEDVSDWISFPKNIHHGTTFEVPKDVYEKLVEKYGIMK